jgi:mono/diheme cytochrome c family protein
MTATGLNETPMAEASPQPETTAVADTAVANQLPAAPLSEADAQAIAAGDALFKGNCAQCHAVDDVVVGPALAGISQRRPLPWIISWVRNSSKVVASGDEYGVKIFNQYQKQQMPSFSLSEQEVEQIMKYIENQAGRQNPGASSPIVQDVAVL